MEDRKKTTAPCPKCRGEAECCCCRVQEGIALYDAYTGWCPACGWQETKRRPAGFKIVNHESYPQMTTCPFCGKPATEHPKGVSLGGVCRALRVCNGEDGSLSSPGGPSRPPS